MLSDRLARALPSRPARIALAVVAYLLFAAAVLTVTLYRDDDDTLTRQAEVAQYEGQAQFFGLDFKPAEQNLRKAIDLIRACGGDGDHGSPEWYAEAHEDLGDVLAAQGRLGEAEAAYRVALRIYERESGPKSDDLID